MLDVFFAFLLHKCIFFKLFNLYCFFNCFHCSLALLLSCSLALLLFCSFASFDEMQVLFESLQSLSQSFFQFFQSLSMLPRCPVEPTILALSHNWEKGLTGDFPNAQAFRSHKGSLGSLIAPCGVRADNVLVRCLPRFVCIGRPLRFELVLSGDYLAVHLLN